MCRKLLSKPFFVKTQSVSLDFVATLTRDSWDAVRPLSPFIMPLRDISLSNPSLRTAGAFFILLLFS